MFELLTILVAIEKLLYPAPYKAKCTFVYPLKPLANQKVYAQLYSTFLFTSTIITPKIASGLRSDFPLSSISEMGIFHTLSLTVGDWPFSITGYFRPKLGHLNERVSYKPIERTLKRQFKEGWGSSLRPTFPKLWEFF